MQRRAVERHASPTVIVGLIVLALVLGVVGAVYLGEQSRNLPAFFPGHAVGSSRHHVKHGMLAIGLGVLALLGAWIGSGKKRRRWDSGSDQAQ